MKQAFTLVVLLSFLLGCEVSKQNAVERAVTTPLHDLKIIKEKIPEPLLAIQAQPYAAPTSPSCAVIAEEVSLLTEILGADVDAEKSEHQKKENLGSELKDESKRVALKELGRATTELIPYRNWVRRLSGATRHSKKIARAIEAGKLRRAYLKGIFNAYQCEKDTKN